MTRNPDLRRRTADGMVKISRRRITYHTGLDLRKIILHNPAKASIFLKKCRPKSQPSGSRIVIPSEEGSMSENDHPTEEEEPEYDQQQYEMLLRCSDEEGYDGMERLEGE